MKRRKNQKLKKVEGALYVHLAKVIQSRPPDDRKTGDILVLSEPIVHL